jgi:hypothetical protein
MSFDIESDTENYSQFENNTAKFQTEYQFWRGQGHSHIVCQRKSIDYYRKYIKHEVTVNWQSVADAYQASQFGEETHSSLELIQFNQIVKQTIEELTPRQKELFCYILMQHNLDQYLNEELAQEVELITEGKRPDSVGEMATMMGLSLTPSKGISPPLTQMRLRIRKAMEGLGLHG